MYPDKKLNILWLTHYPISKNHHPSPWIKSLAEALVEERHNLTLITLSSKVKIIEESMVGNGYRLIIIPYQGGITHLMTGFYTQVSSLKKYLQNDKINYDIIHVHGTELQYASALIKSKINIPFITSIQGLITLCRKELKLNFTLKPIYWKIASIYEKYEIRNTKNFFCRTKWDTSFVKTINSQANVFECWEILRKEFYEYQHKFLGNDILFMGGSTDLKGLDIALISFNNFLKISRSAASLHIAGFVEKNFIQKILKSKRLHLLNEQNLIIHGKLSAAEICSVYNKCFCLYHPSLIDNSPNSVCEAQLAGMPVVATNVGGVSSLIKNGENGILVTKNNVEEHVTELLKLFKDKNFQKKIGAAAKIMATGRHNKTSIVKNTIEAYQKIKQIDCKKIL